MMKNGMWLVLFFFAFFYIEAAEKSKEPLQTSLIIPCHPKHVKYLYELLNAYEKQTVLPDEVVISISESDQIEPHIIKNLRESQWHFPVRFLLSRQQLFAGQNRNIACSHATGEIIVCQDADDLPHPQRIEVIKYFFEKFGLDFLLHKFVYDKDPGENGMKQLRVIEDLDCIKYEYLKTYHQAWEVGYMLFGQPAFRREVFSQIKWRDIPIDEDNAWDTEVLNTFTNCIMIHVPLYIYRIELSATPYELYR